MDFKLFASVVAINILAWLLCDLIEQLRIKSS